MPVNLDELGWGFAVLVADADTPSTMLVFVGRPIPIPPGVELPSTHDSITFNGQTFWGYARQNTNNGNTEWVMTAPSDPTATFLSTLPGPDGWLNQAAYNQVRSVGVSIRRKGITGAELRPAFQTVYAAVVAERDAQILAAGGRLGPEDPAP